MTKKQYTINKPFEPVKIYIGSKLLFKNIYDKLFNKSILNTF